MFYDKEELAVMPDFGSDDAENQASMIDLCLINIDAIVHSGRARSVDGRHAAEPDVTIFPGYARLRGRD